MKILTPQDLIKLSHEQGHTERDRKRWATARRASDKMQSKARPIKPLRFVSELGKGSINQKKLDEES